MPAVWSVCAFGPFTWKPSSFRRSCCWSFAITSTRWTFSAWSAGRLVALVTIWAATFALRPCEPASARTYATASFRTLRPSVPLMLPPLESIGVAEPMLVCGAIAATSEAWAMYMPAEAAREPFG